MEYKCTCRMVNFVTDDNQLILCSEKQWNTNVPVGWYVGINTITNVMVGHTQIYKLVPLSSTFRHDGLFQDLEDFECIDAMYIYVG